jgi:hypothetical protein
VYWSTLLFAIGFGTYCLAYGVLVILGHADVGHRRLSGLDAFSSGLVFVSFAAGAWLLWWRLGCARMIVDDTSVVIVNPIRRQRVPRDELARLAATSLNGWVLLVTTNGRRIPVFALSVGFRWTLRKRMANVAQMIGVPLS